MIVAALAIAGLAALALLGILTWLNMRRAD
jgi:hypothetical protein